MSEQSKTILNVSDAPHVKVDFYIKDCMINIMLSLCPLLILGVYNYGTRVVSILAVSCLSACIFELLWCYIEKKKNTVGDLSALCAGMLLTCVYNPSVPLWIPVIGSFFAVIIFKKLMGGLGKSIINPIAASMLLLYALFPAQTLLTVEKKCYLPTFAIDPNTVDIIAGSTPLASLREGIISESYGISDMILGNMSGAIGCISALLIVACASFMIIKHTISFALPCTMTLAMALLCLAFPAGESALVFTAREILTGSFLFSVFFVATDYATTPLTRSGRIIYGIGCSLFTFLFRYFSSSSEGIFFAICLMDLTVPLLDRVNSLLPSSDDIVKFLRRKGGKV